jgi:hypothetical protein
METQNQWLNYSKKELNEKYEEFSNERERVEVELRKSDWYKREVTNWREAKLQWSIDDLLGLEWDTCGDDNLEQPPCDREKSQLATNLEALGGLLEAFHEDVWEALDKLKSGGAVGEDDLIASLSYKIALEYSCGLIGRLAQDEPFFYQPND